MLAVGEQQFLRFLTSIASPSSCGFPDMPNVRTLKYTFTFSKTIESARQEEHILHTLSQEWWGFDRLDIKGVKNISLAQRTISDITGPRWSSREDFLGELHSVYDQGVEILLQKDYTRSMCYLIRATDMLIVLPELAHQYAFVDEPSFRSVFNVLAHNVVRDCAIAFISIAAAGYVLMTDPQKSHCWKEEDEEKMLHATNHASGLLSMSLKLARSTTDPAKAKAELYYRHFFVYLLCGDIRRARIALQAARSFAPGEEKIHMVEDVSKMYSIGNRVGYSIMCRYLATPYLKTPDMVSPSEMMSMVPLLKTTDIGSPLQTRQQLLHDLKIGMYGPLIKDSIIARV